MERSNHNTEIYSGSATRTPSLPYSTPRVTYSRVFFTMSTNSLMAEKPYTTLAYTGLTTQSKMSSPNRSQNQSHNLYTTSTRLNHDFFTTSSQRLHDFFTTSSSRLLHDYFFTTTSQLLIHNYFTTNLQHHYVITLRSTYHNYTTLYTTTQLNEVSNNTSSLVEVEFFFCTFGGESLDHLETNA